MNSRDDRSENNDELLPHDEKKLQTFFREKWPLHSPKMILMLVESLIAPLGVFYLYNRGETLPTFFTLILTLIVIYTTLSLYFHHIQKRNDTRKLIEILVHKGEVIEIRDLAEEIDSFSEKQLRDLLTNLQDEEVIDLPL